MSIREYVKDHLKEHAGVESATPDMLLAPESDDPLIFWTRREKESIQIDLHPFATGQVTSKCKPDFVAFTGRPALIGQLAPAIEDRVLGVSLNSVNGCLYSLRAWWRVLDAVEAAAEQVGTHMARVEDVRQLTMIHSEFAHRSGMKATSFTTFRAIADATRIALGARPLHWQTPETPDVQRHQLPDEQAKLLRLALKRECRGVLEKWALMERLKEIKITPDDPREANLHRHVQYMLAMQNKYDKVLPTPDELRDGIDGIDFKAKTGLSLRTLRETAFPTRWDADAAYHLCLCNTGWNPCTLLALDVTKEILLTHPKDAPNNLYKRFVLSPETYTLTGHKARSGDKEQIVFGLWKTIAGPGHIIKTYMERVAPLRELLMKRLVEERRRYAELVRDGAPYEEGASQFKCIQRLEQGCRSVWLYVDKYSNIVWLNSRILEGHVNAEGKKTTYINRVLDQLNAQRAVLDYITIPRVTPADFRDFFATYVWRVSGGSILAVKRALSHAQLRTTAGYLDNNILNKEADDAARGFLNALVDELGKERLDITILAHLQRHGPVTPKMEQRLAEYRSLTRSRMNIACKNPRNPPLQIRASGKGLCDDNRCLLCPENAVLLPESYDGIAMRTEEILALQANLPIETWINADYPLELKNNLAALRLFDLNLVLMSRRRWAAAIANGEHFVPGIPICINEMAAT